MKRIKEFRPDVIHIQQEFSIGLAGVRAARALHLPLIYTLHTMYDDYIYYIGARPAAPESHGEYLTTMCALSPAAPTSLPVLQRSALIISQTPECTARCMSFRTRWSSTITAKRPPLRNQRAAIRERYHIPADAFVTCFCGRIGKEKGVDNLIKLWHSQCGGDPSFYLMIIGEGPFRKELEALAQSYGLGDRIIFTGAVPHEQVSPYYACCNAYATASLSEMYSISMLEAQASGLPVVQWLDPDNVDQIKVGVNGYLFETAEEFGRIIHQLAAVTPEQRIELAKRVRDSVKERSSDSIANYLLDLYQQAINKHR